MKKRIFITVALFAFTSITSQLFAQDAARVKAGYNVKTNIKCRVIESPAGCDIVCEHSVVSPRDVASGLPTGKRMHKPYIFSVSSDENVVSPKDLATGQASGKVNVQDISMTKRSSGAGTGKVSLQDFHFVVKNKGKIVPVTIEDGECVFPEDCPDGEYSLVCDWSWGMSNSGSGRCAASFLLTIENGDCTAMAINEKGLPGDKGNKGTKK